MPAQTISLLGHLTVERRVAQPHLVVVPLTTLQNWQNELAKWCPKLRVVRLHGTREERARIISEELLVGSFDVCVTTYEVIGREPRALYSRHHLPYMAGDWAGDARLQADRVVVPRDRRGAQDPTHLPNMAASSPPEYGRRTSSRTRSRSSRRSRG